jgi:hypothetical protein
MLINPLIVIKFTCRTTFSSYLALDQIYRTVRITSQSGFRIRIRIQSGQRIRIRNPDPDPGGQK